MQHRPKKRFGQNFLQDQQVVDRIIEAAELDSSDNLLEVGPGLGALTNRLLPAVGQMHVMELDRDLAASFQARPESNLQVHIGDALRLDWAELLTEPPYKLVANLPYNISSQILFKILDNRQLFSRLVLMFQQEVGDRLCAEPNSKQYGILSVLCQNYFDVRRVVRVAPGAFFPPPKVHSVVLCFDALDKPRVAVTDERFFRKVVKGAFGQRRKTLRNSLQGAGLAFDGLIEALTEIGIDSGRRAETLTLVEFGALAEMLRVRLGDGLGAS